MAKDTVSACTDEEENMLKDESLQNHLQRESLM